ncbi:MAG: formimidoylglutamate deiminase [Epsilonproteobacteria bacterium]|nr:MAG: formimidoylglutamate deiminase [Campylobacterota bacterium]RLA67651.1 MAG: formimidoylglutamate deiminase [Campylobacterota bacterium]
MKWWKLKGLYSDEKWHGPCFVKTDARGIIVSIGEDAPEKFEAIDGLAIPGFLNAHSHAFQYSMVGLSENLPPGAKGDDFWSWRKVMYELAGKISPEGLQAIATMLYAEMARMGITHVAEFHYVHHQANGEAFDDVGEMGKRLYAAAKEVGINITLLPVFYQRGGFGKGALPEQKRFISSTTNDYLKLLESLEVSDPLFSLGVCVHSLRAVDGPQVLEAFLNTDKKLPAHIHIAEQEKEVQSCLQHLGKRPVEWLLDNLELNDRYNLVHATHLDNNETHNLAQSGANVVICPTTEANLGDGLFNLVEYLKVGGQFSIGTDGNFNLNPLQELRLLDYGQRLKLKKRNIMCLADGQDSGEILFNLTRKAGLKAMGIKDHQALKVGDPFDVAVINPDHPVLASKKNEYLLSALIYSADSSVFSGNIVAGNWVIKNGKHIKIEKISETFKKAQLELLG